MECTQRLECTQELYESRPERICPEQIGFLGICGAKHPIKRGPNKIGRDPQTCSIVLNLNSISRQHAVINVLNSKEYMLMDLDSANKTKLMEKILPPYIPHPLKNGDMVQFGDIFGVFRLLEEDTDLPMTQAMDMPDTQVPETPISNRNVSKLNKIPITTIPESPDVSDKDDSFIVPSQPKRDKCFRNSNSHFIKPASKVISIQPIGTNKIDNIYWNSSKKSVSLNSQFNDSNSSLNDSMVSEKTTSRVSNDKSIYEMETQAPAPCEANESTDSIYTANTQVPPAIHMVNTQAPSSIQAVSTQDPTSIYNADTQVPPAIHNASTQLLTSIHTDNTQAPCVSPSIHVINTQLPPSTNLPEVCKIDNQKEMRFDLCTSNKNMFEAETQGFEGKKDVEICKNVNETKGFKDKTSNKPNVSEEEILIEVMDCQDFDNDFESQALLPTGDLIAIKDNECSETPPVKGTVKKNSKSKNKIIIDSDSSTDCEDIDMLPTQKITEKQAGDEDITDCEDLFDDDLPQNPGIDCKKLSEQSKIDNFEDMLTQVITLDDIQNNVSNASANKIEPVDVNFEDLPTQVIPPCEDKSSTSCVNLEDMPTQIIVDDTDGVIIADKPIVQQNPSLKDMPTKVLINDKPTSNVDEELVSPFKIPLISPRKAKRKDIKVITPKSKLVLNKISDDNYYAATQDILEDLCTQPDTISSDVIKDNECPSNNIDDDFLPSSVEEYKVGRKFPHLENDLSPKRGLNISIDSSDGDDVNNFVSNLTSQQVRDVIGVEPVDKLKRVPSDPSDVELTPKKVRPIKFMDIDLPNSQEIKTSISIVNTKTPVTESSSESEVENDSEECTPILFRKKKKPKVNAKVDLTKLFAAESLPTRVITRVRKPPTKFQNEDTTKLTRNILKPKFLTEQEDEIDKEIISENMSRLRSKLEKSKNKEANKDTEKKKMGKVKDENKKHEKENANKSDVTNNMEVAANSKSEINSVKSEKAPVSSKKDVVDTVKTKIELDKPKDNKTNQRVPKKASMQKSGNDEKRKTDTDVSPNVTKDSQNTDSTIETSIDSKPTRSTRTRRKVNESKEKQSISIEDDSQSDKKKPSRKQTTKKTIEIDLTDEGSQNKRSRRQQKSNDTETKQTTEKRDIKLEKENNKTVKPATRRGRPPKQPAGRTAKAEQSTIYSLSSESGPDTPKSILKRSAPEILDPPSPKRTRSAANSGVSLRATPARTIKTQYVLFTAFPCEEVKAKLEKLGAVVVTDVRECTMVLTLAVKRTFKLLCAVGLGRPIVGPPWVQACADTNMIVDPWLYILKDEVAEKRFQFSLEKTLSGKRNFLNGFHVSSTPSVLPTTAEMKLIVECSGGTWKDEGPQWICVSCAADKALWPALKKRGATVVSTEFILGGVLRQRPDIVRNKLSCAVDKALWPALKKRGATVVSTEFILGGVLRQRPDIVHYNFISVILQNGASKYSKH